MPYGQSQQIVIDSRIVIKLSFFFVAGERYDFVITADQAVGAFWMQLRGLGECGIKRTQQLAILRYARGPYQPATQAPTYDVGIPQGVVSRTHFF